MKFLILCTVIGFVVGDKLPQAPYPASGWRPQGATFQLPNEYGPPHQQQSNVEISQQNIHYAGQFVETTTDFQPSNEYLPPGAANTEYPQVIKFWFVLYSQIYLLKVNFSPNFIIITNKVKSDLKICVLELHNIFVSSLFL